jgi:hypothetical protein
MLSDSASAKTLESLGVLTVDKTCIMTVVTPTGMESHSDSRELAPAESASRPRQS